MESLLKVINSDGSIYGNCSGCACRAIGSTIVILPAFKELALGAARVAAGWMSAFSVRYPWMRPISSMSLASAMHLAGACWRFNDESNTAPAAVMWRSTRALGSTMAAQWASIDCPHLSSGGSGARRASTPFQPLPAAKGPVSGAPEAAGIVRAAVAVRRRRCRRTPEEMAGRSLGGATQAPTRPPRYRWQCRGTRGRGTADGKASPAGAEAALLGLRAGAEAALVGLRQVRARWQLGMQGCVQAMWCRGNAQHCRAGARNGGGF